MIIQVGQAVSRGPSDNGGPSPRCMLGASASRSYILFVMSVRHNDSLAPTRLRVRRNTPRQGRATSQSKMTEVVVAHPGLHLIGSMLCGVCLLLTGRPVAVGER